MTCKLEHLENSLELPVTLQDQNIKDSDTNFCLYVGPILSSAFAVDKTSVIDVGLFQVRDSENALVPVGFRIFDFKAYGSGIEQIFSVKKYRSREECVLLKRSA